MTRMKRSLLSRIKLITYFKIDKENFGNTNSSKEVSTIQEFIEAQRPETNYQKKTWM